MRRHYITYRVAVSYAGAYGVFLPRQHLGRELCSIRRYDGVFGKDSSRKFVYKTPLRGLRSPSPGSEILIASGGFTEVWSMHQYSLDYGTCPCLGRFEKRTVDVRMTLADKLVVLSGVSQGVCPLCGSRVYKAETLERIESLMKQGDPNPATG
jgi:hypothetical protein